jgi:tRNA(Ile)-lysidine synthase
MNIDSFLTIVQENCNLSTIQQILVAVSGGADSMAMLQLFKEAGYSVTAAHLNHKIRSNAVLDAEFVGDICTKWGIPFIYQQVDVPAYCRMKRISTEEGAREVRYSFLFDCAKKYNAQAIAVGHHADDQVETVLMHLFRGAGLSGLKGMQVTGYLSQYSMSIPLIRPLLGFLRQEIRNYCKENQVPYIEDQSNLDIRYDRNRIRSEIIPNLEKYYPALKKVILNNIIPLQADHQFIESEVEKAWKICDVKSSEVTLSLELEYIQQLQRGLRWNLLRKAVNMLKVNIRDFDLLALKRLDELVVKELSNKVELTNHLVAQVHEGRLWLSTGDFVPPIRIFPQIDNEFFVNTYPYELITSNGWVLQAEKFTQVDHMKIVYEDAKQFEAWLDFDSIRGWLSFRHKIPGEKMQPMGMQGKHSLISDLFINHGISRLARQNYPLVADNDKVIWLPGVSVSEMCKVTPETRVIMHLRLLPPI